MKRSPLNRKTPLKRTELKRKSPMKCYGELMREKVRRQLRDVRAAYRKKFSRCMICGTRPPQDVHEIRGGMWRHITEHLPSFWLALCRRCHDEIHQTDRWPYSRQLAVKFRSDPNHFDLLEYNATLEKEVPVTMEEIESHLEAKPLRECKSCGDYCAKEFCSKLCFEEFYGREP